MLKVVFMCALSKIKRKRVPNLLLGICIVITTALLVNAFILIRELDTIFDRAYEEMDGPQMCCLWNRETLPPDRIRQYLDGWQENLTYQITEKTKTIDYMEKGGKRLSNGILLELPQTAGRQMLSPKMPDSETPEPPGQNQIWITTKMANILGLKTGDDLVLKLADQAARVRVAKVVSDPVFGSGSTNVYRMWCGFGQLSSFPLSENNAASYLEIQFKEYSPQAERNFISQAEAHFNIPFGDTVYTYDRIKSGYTGPYQMIGAALCLLSVILAGTILALTLFLIRSDMDEDIRTIGIYKSLGMTGRQIAGIYLGCYGMISLAGASAGSILGGQFSKTIIAKVLGDIGLYTFSFGSIWVYQILSGILMLAAVTVLCLCAIFKVRTLNAAHAVRTGSWKIKERRQKESKGAYYGGGASFERYYAVRGMKNRKARYAYIAGAALILGCLSITCLGCLNAVQNIDRDPELWGFIKTDIYVTSQEDTPVSHIIAELEKDPQILYTYGANKITSQYKPAAKETWRSIATEVYQLPWREEVKDRSLWGRHPLRENEIGIGMALAREYGLQVGDSMELVINGKKVQYRITGIFQTLSNYGNVIRMVTKDLDQFVKRSGAYADYMLVLADSARKWESAKELAERYGGKFSFIASKSNGENITGVLAPAVGMMLTVLLIVSLLIAVNLTFLLIRREQKLIGLLKAVGMTSRQIVKIYSWRNGLAALAGNSLGLLLGIWAIPKLLSPYAAALGLSEFPFVNSLAGTAVSFFALPLCILLSTYAVINAIGRVTVKQLVSE
ncbi:MAG: FtsX-like permease family protein [Firmicutes bacterium]|nr:FtsX-like permease family protein [Bacillota bacterium]